ncbi:MAG: 50S ribosomal protein L10 [Clostridiales bacterium]|nr:50S ribosomal protein L10 [Clostridiales bacterium]
MANAANIASKAQQVAEVAEKLRKAKGVVFFDFKGLTVEEVTAIRKDMREKGLEYVVVKNHIMSRACDEVGIDASVHGMLKGPSAFAFGYEDAAAPAKVLKEAIKKYKKCELKGGVVEGAVTNAKDMDAIADLPSREVLIARLLGSMMSPISGLAIVLDQIAKKMGAPAEEAQA